jgi:hypothetical protein
MQFEADTSSPGLSSARVARSSACWAPPVTMIWSGSQRTARAAFTYSQIAARNSISPHGSLYPRWVVPKTRKARLVSFLQISAVRMSTDIRPGSNGLPSL